MGFLDDADPLGSVKTMAYVALGMLIALPVPVGIAWMQNRYDRGRVAELSATIEKSDGNVVVTSIGDRAGDPGIRISRRRADGTSVVLDAYIDDMDGIGTSYRDGRGCLVEISGVIDAAQLVALVRKDPARTGAPYEHATWCQQEFGRTVR